MGVSAAVFGGRHALCGYSNGEYKNIISINYCLWIFFWAQKKGEYVTVKDYEKFEVWLQYGTPDGEMGDESEYPIAGCREVLAKIAKKIKKTKAESVLCIGAGSEIIARELYKDGRDVWIVDILSFDEAHMADLEAEMPEAHFLNYDFLEEMPEELDGLSFDAIACSYLLHIVGEEEKLVLIEELANMLSLYGTLYIGDVCFWTSAEHEICRRRCGESWDDEANYFVYDDFAKLFNSIYGEGHISFLRISHCAGIIQIS